MHKFGGFAFSHVLNYCLQLVLLNIFLFLGCGEKWAPTPVLSICIPTNYILVRHFLHK